MIWGKESIRSLAAGRKTQFRECMPEGTKVPPYKPGDILRVRENWNAYWGARYPDGRVVFDADVAQADGGVYRATKEDPIHVFYEADDRFDSSEPWRPAKEMPEWASRFHLRVAECRIERLRKITEADAEASGLEFEIWDMALAVRDYSKPAPAWFHMWSTHEGEPGYVPEDRIWRASFRTLWESMHGPGSFDANPLVAVTRFEIAAPTP